MGKKTDWLIEALDVAGDVAKCLAAGLGGEAVGSAAAIFIDEFLILRDEGIAGYEIVKGVPLVPNTLFESHGIEGECDYTRKYIERRKLKSIGGSLVSTAGAIGSAGTGGVNVGGVIRHGAADLNTLAHLAILGSHSRKFKQSDWLSHHCSVLLRMKTLKLSVRSTQLAGDCVNALTGALCGLGATVTGKTVVKAMDRLTTKTALELHWRAYQEQAILGSIGKGSGPASNMMKELLTRRAHVWLGGQYDWKRVVKEPTGWLVIHDKINLL